MNALKTSFLPTTPRKAIVWFLALIVLALVIRVSWEVYQVFNPTYYYYGNPLPLEEIRQRAQGIRCVQMGQYSYMCFDSMAEMDAFSERRSAIKLDVLGIATLTPAPTPVS